MITLVSGMWVLGWIELFVVTGTLPQLSLACYFAFASGQTAFLGHDAGHRQIFRDRGLNDAIGLFFSNLILGVSYGWWVDKHNRHHAHPNNIDSDPDIGIAVFAFTCDQAREKRGLHRILTRHQTYLFFPLLLFELIHIYVVEVRFLLARRDRRAVVEAGLLVVHFVVYTWAVFSVTDLLHGLTFVALHLGLTGLYLGTVFAPNHKGMSTFSDERKVDFLRRQVLASRNLRAHPVTDFLWGGVNFQIEHHLFPTMPRNNLRQAQNVVRDFCNERGVCYREDHVIESYKEILHHLHDVSAPLRAN